MALALTCKWEFHRDLLGCPYRYFPLLTKAVIGDLAPRPVDLSGKLFE